MYTVSSLGTGFSNTLFSRGTEFTAFRDSDSLNCAGQGARNYIGQQCSAVKKIQELFTPCSQGADRKLFGRNRINQALISQQHVTTAGHSAGSAVQCRLGRGWREGQAEQK